MSKVNQLAVPASPPPDTQLSVPIGERLLQVLGIAYRAKRPVLLEGPTGIGKSEIVAHFAARAGIDHRILDLSLLEPPDLIGLPVIDGGRTTYACPAELPTGGAGVLLLEELNRAEMPVMQPALQLLSARRLHSYELPAGWICIAAINPEQDEYQVNRLDPALRSRFLQIAVRAAQPDWLAWAEKKRLHPLVLDVVRQNADVFATSQPRAWKYLSDVLLQMTEVELRNRDLLLTMAQGYLPVAWAVVLVEAVAGTAPLSTLDEKMLAGRDAARRFRELVQNLLAAGRTDAVAALAARIVALAGTPKAQGIEWDVLFAPLPGDLRRRCAQEARRRDAATGVSHGGRGEAAE